MDRYDSTLAQQSATPTISRRAYNALTYGMVTVSFLVTWGMYLFVQGGTAFRLFAGVSPIVMLVAYLAGTIGGIVVMGIGKSKESVGLSLVGYALFTLTFGGSLALLLTQYNVGTIYYAFAITACISGIFLIAGVMFPNFFASIGRLLMVGLLALVVVEAVAVIFFHADQTIFDYITIALFCGFLGYDSLLMAADEPTVPNAIFHASNIYIDIVNILIRVLSILDRD